MGPEVPIITTKVKDKVCHLKVDEASNSKGFGIEIVLYSPKGDMIENNLKLGFPANYNETKY